MRFFRRGDSPTGNAAFWTWWATARDRVAAAIVGGGLDQVLVKEISDAVRGIHPSMAWELAPGRTSQHALCITPEGNAELRQHALRWLATAPDPDAVWEYHASRQPSPEALILEVDGGVRYDFGEMRAISSWDPSRMRVDVRLWHPGFEQAPERGRLQVAFNFLDNLLGEDDVERWIGVIDLLDGPTGGKTPDELRAEIERRKTESATDETWVIGTLEGAGEPPMIVLADASLKRIDHPFADHHVEVIVDLGDVGMPNGELGEALNAEEDDLVARLTGRAVLAARTTVPGRRVIHFVTEDPAAVRSVIDAWARSLSGRRIKVEAERDMAWSFQDQLGL